MCLHRYAGNWKIGSFDQIVSILFKYFPLEKHIYINKYAMSSGKSSRVQDRTWPLPTLSSPRASPGSVGHGFSHPLLPAWMPLLGIPLGLLVLYILIGQKKIVFGTYCCWTGWIWLFVLQFINYWAKYPNVCCHNSGWMVENVTKMENFSRTFKFQKVSDIFFTCMCFKSRLIGWFSGQNNYFPKRAK